MSNYGLKTAPTGTNVLTASNKELTSNSQLDTFRVFRFGEYQASYTTGNVLTVRIQHGLKYRPATLVYSELDAGSSGQFFVLPYTLAVGGDGSVISYVTNEDLVIRFGDAHSASNKTFLIRYFIFYNPAL